MSPDAHDDLSGRLQSLGTSLSERGFVVVSADEARAVYLQPPVDWIALTVVFGADGSRRKVGGHFSLAPLVRPEPAAISVDLEFDMGHGSRTNEWSIGELEQNPVEFARSLDVQIVGLRARYGTPQAFANEVDDDYLYDDSPDLAEAVAYLWLLSDDVSMAMRRMSDLIADRDMIDPSIAARATTMLALTSEDPSAATARLVSWRESLMKELGFDPPLG